RRFDLARLRVQTRRRDALKRDVFVRTDELTGAGKPLRSREPPLGLFRRVLEPGRGDVRNELPPAQPELGVVRTRVHAALEQLPSSDVVNATRLRRLNSDQRVAEVVRIAKRRVER